MKRSVIIPTVKTLAEIEQSLQSLQALIAPPEEVIVVQNGLTDAERKRDRDAYAGYTDRFKPLRLKFFHDDVPGLLTGRHRGAMEATGELLIFVDDDVTFSPNWLHELSGVFQDPDVALAGGPSLPAFAAEPPNWLQRCWHSTPCGGRKMAQLSLLELKTNTTIEIAPDLVWGLNYAIRRDALRKHGGFHPDCVPAALQHFQGDGETGLSKKLMEAGKRAVYNPQAIVNHHIESERMTKRYFDQRSFYQGVCDSYTAIRGGTDPTILLAEKEEKPAWPIVTWAKQLKRALSPPAELDALQARFYRSYTRGFEFHCLCVQSSQRLLHWVRQESYFDYNYPSLEAGFSPAPRQVHDPSYR